MPRITHSELRTQVRSRLRPTILVAMVPTTSPVVQYGHGLVYAVLNDFSDADPPRIPSRSRVFTKYN